MTSGLLKCSRCKQDKDVEEFAPSRRIFGQWCRACYAEWNVERRGGIVEKTCPQCNNAFEVTAISTHKRFCSLECKNNFQKDKQALERVAARAGRPCQNPSCAAEIPDDRRADTLYCSDLCQNQANRLRNPMLKHRSRAKQYGISVERYLELKDSPCAICGRTADEVGRPLHIDHCHTGGQVRGALCGGCNTGLGQFRDRADLLRAAAEYLEK